RSRRYTDYRDRARKSSSGAPAAPPPWWRYRRCRAPGRRWCGISTWSEGYRTSRLRSFLLASTHVRKAFDAAAVQHKTDILGAITSRNDGGELKAPWWLRHPLGVR